MSKPVMLEVQHLTKRFPQGRRGSLLAVDDVSLSIHAGETFGLVGESGCGKSTLGSMIAHLLPPTAGKIYFTGGKTTTEITALRGAALRSLRRQMQIIFQDPYSSLNPKKTIGWLLEEPLRIHHIGKTAAERREKVLSALENVGLDGSYADRLPAMLSGGQRQRVAIAIAFLLEPSFVICDEAVSALDVSIQAQVLNLLQSLQRERGTTYLFISHNLDVVSYMADRIGVMYLGRLVELGDAAAISEHPLHPYTRALFASSMRVDGPRGEVPMLTGELPSPAKLPTGCAFHTRCPYCTDRCVKEAPALRTRSDGRAVACHRTEENFA